MTIDMAGKAALVTGAASGLGRATAIRLAEAGANVFAIDVNEAGLAETAALLGSASHTVRVADLSDPAECAAVVAEAVAAYGRLDALCNVAGLIYLVNTPEMALDQYRRTIDVNLSAPFLLSQAAIPHLLESNGAIVNVASSAAFIGEAYAAAYCASKWGLVGMTKAMAMEYAKKPIRINAVAPGGMLTEISEATRPPADADFAKIMRYSGQRPPSDVAEVAEVVGFISSPAASAVHGAIWTADGGVTAG